MRRALISCAFAGLSLGLFLSCDDDSPAKPEQPEFAIETHVIRDIDYVKDKYFYFDDPAHFLGLRVFDPQIEVYRTVTPADLIRDPTILRLPGWVMADSAGDGQAIRDAAAVISNGGIPARALRQDFERLQPGADYDFIIDALSQRTVGIKLVDPVPASALKAIGVTYINEDGTPVGGTYATLGVGSSDSLMLEMLKAPDPRPQGSFGTTWRLAARNVYYLGTRDIRPNALTVGIEDVLDATRPDPTSPAGSSVSYLRIFGLDQTGSDGSGPPDGLVDPWFVDLTAGILVFPSAESFAPDSEFVDMWTDGLFAFTDPYQAQYDKSGRIYDELLNPTAQLDVHQYNIMVTVKRRIIPPPM
jgi:hypothetical protein